jgi:hypothetical protein
MPRFQWLAEAWCLKFDILSSIVLDIVRAFLLMEIVDYTKFGSVSVGTAALQLCWSRDYVM